MNDETKQCCPFDDLNLTKVQKMSLFPNDIIVLKHPDALSMQARNNILKSMRTMLNKHGLGNEVCLLTGGMDIEIIERELPVKVVIDTRGIGS